MEGTEERRKDYTAFGSLQGPSLNPARSFCRGGNGDLSSKRRAGRRVPAVSTEPSRRPWASSGESAVTARHDGTGLYPRPRTAGKRVSSQPSGRTFQWHHTDPDTRVCGIQPDANHSSLLSSGIPFLISILLLTTRPQTHPAHLPTFSLALFTFLHLLKLPGSCPAQNESSTPRPSWNPRA